MTIPIRLRGLSAAAISLAWTSLSAQAPFPPLPSLPSERAVEVMIVGVFHFAQQDTSRFDVLDARRQREIDAVIRRLARFRPTKVMVEWQPYFRQRFIDSTYALHRTSSFALPRNEVYQLGYRLAAAAGLSRVWAIDHSGFWLGDSLRTIARAMNQLNLLDGSAPHARPDPAAAVPDSVLFARASIREILGWLNHPRYQALMYDGYVNRMARVGIVAGDDFDVEENEIGAELLAQWISRNVKIYRHVLARTNYDARDRIIVFIGSDHVEPLRQLFAANLNFRVVSAWQYLR